MSPTKKIWGWAECGMGKRDGVRSRGEEPGVQAEVHWVPSRSGVLSCPAPSEQHGGWGRKMQGLLSEERKGADGESPCQTLDEFVISCALDLPVLGVGVTTRLTC